MCAHESYKCLLAGGVSNPRKLELGQCNGVVMMGLGWDWEEGGSILQSCSHSIHSPICRTLAESLLSLPLSFCKFSELLANGTSQMYHSSSWQKIPDLVFPPICFFGNSSSSSSGSSWVTIPVSEKPRVCF